MKKIYQSGLTAALLVAIGSTTALSQKVASTSMEFLEVMPVARATAMGDAYSVLANGADAVFWNPSGLALIQNQQVSSTFVKWIFDTKQGAASYALPIPSVGAVGVQIQYVDFGVFDEAIATRPYINQEVNPGLTGNTFHPFSYLVGFSYARSLTDRFATGFSVKYAHESLYNGQMVLAQVSQGVYQEVKTWASGVIFDFGIHYNTGFKTVQIGASVQNFGADVTYAQQSNPVPLLFRWGIAGDLIGKDALLSSDDENRIGVAFDLYQPNDYGQQEHLGVEYEYAGVFALRAGYKFNYDYEGLTLGAGVKQMVSTVKLSLDYSYGSIGPYLGSVHRISLGADIQ
ncbi:MAG TPA: PorV/PorQ family protein [Bacteroidota bacterium]|nr:PorV/PorQ family protein [Bacteroidota bacterium]